MSIDIIHKYKSSLWSLIFTSLKESKSKVWEQLSQRNSYTRRHLRTFTAVFVSKKWETYMFINWGTREIKCNLFQGWHTTLQLEWTQSYCTVLMFKQKTLQNMYHILPMCIKHGIFYFVYGPQRLTIIICLWRGVGGGNEGRRYVLLDLEKMD